MKHFYNLFLLTLCLSAFTVNTTNAQCSGFPAASTTVAANTSVCLTENVVLSLGTTYSDSFTYQWQSSFNGGQWGDLSGETSATLDMLNVGTRYYRCKVTCTNSGMPSYSSSVLVTATGLACEGQTLCETAPATTNILVTGTDVCGGSNVTFTLDTEYTNNETFQWQYAGFNGFFITIPGATSASYTTTVTDTFDYRVVITCEAGNLSTTTESIEIEVNNTPPALADPAPIFCNASAVGDLIDALAPTGTDVLYYDVATGGEPLALTTALNTGTSYYASQVVNGCRSVTRTQIVVILSEIILDEQEDVTTCDTYELPALNRGNYYTATGGPDGEGSIIQPGTLITTTQGVYVYAETSGRGNCTAEVSFTVNVNPIAAPAGATEQTIFATDADPAFVTDIEVTGTDVFWYLTPEAALAGVVAPVRLDTPLVSGTTYYAIQIVTGCRSAEVLPVTVTLETLGIDNPEAKLFSYYPNPVNDVLTVSHPAGIASVSVYSLLGQQLTSKKADAVNATVDMSALTAGTYIVNITAANNTVKTLRVVKK
ncbi:hypothetical protein Q765_20535 [Flavobacterium rivuli WB 3.3-2 = DSM 21788]|uniref:Secretion system C-terminal sorting domain-containing protein n=1 Tax=Flavobacterium rivuli WB 3.3-2 = DSM 21788 TaxID=1121895 RepID=A0A0A2LWC7_9FLAO|nr:T9SS type A sorting domain-containing protein [Flavobacterium rivuli]KGO84647.1 hypothetical protein Q765_20535 [Flavobacterium rivuli WB 3.3-2 = DSM 21788]